MQKKFNLRYSPKSHDFHPALDFFRYLHEDLVLKGSSKIFLQVDSHFETILWATNSVYFCLNFLQARWRSCVAMEILHQCLESWVKTSSCPRNLSVRGMKMAAEMRCFDGRSHRGNSFRFSYGQHLTPFPLWI